MGSGGHNRKTDAQKVIEGTFRPGRSSASGPGAAVARATRGQPDVDEYLRGRPKREREIFAGIVQRLERIQLGSETYTEAVGLLAGCLYEMEMLQRRIKREGRYYTANGLRKRHPALADLTEARRHAQSLLNDLGLTPRAIAKAAPSDSAGKPDDDKRPPNPFTALDQYG